MRCHSLAIDVFDTNPIPFSLSFAHCLQNAIVQILHIDRNSYYGGESASLNLEDLYKKFRGSETPPKELGRTRDYCVDLCPKFIMACGKLFRFVLMISCRVCFGLVGLMLRLLVGACCWSCLWSGSSVFVQFVLSSLQSFDFVFACLTFDGDR